MVSLRSILIRLAATLALGGGVIWATQAPAATIYHYTFSCAEVCGYDYSNFTIDSPSILMTNAPVADPDVTGGLNGFVPPGMAGGGFVGFPADSFGYIIPTIMQPAGTVISFAWFARANVEAEGILRRGG